MNKKQLREEIYNEYFGKCGYCGTNIDYKDMQVDHIISQRNFKRDILNRVFVPKFLLHLTINDVNAYENLMCTCRSCNNYKSAFYLEDFRKELGMQIERLNNNSTNYKLAKRYKLIKETEIKIEFYFEKYIENNKLIRKTKLGTKKD